MGFWSSALKGITGAASGFLASGGNPLGAIVGGVSGLTSGGDTTSRSGSETANRRVDMRAWNPEEEAMLANAQLGVQQANMTPEERAAMEQSYYQNLYNPAKKALDQTYATGNAQNYGNRARRGAGANSQGVGQDRASVASQASATADLNAQATLMATQARQAEELNRQRTVQNYMNQINSLWRNRMLSSGITTTGSNQAQVTGPDTFWQSAAYGAGRALMDPENKFSLFGANKPADPTRTAIPGEQGPFLTP